MDKILILDSGGSSWIRWTDNCLRKLHNVKVEKMYNDVNFSLRIIRKLHYLTNISKKELWYSSWKKEIFRFDKIIVFSSPLLGNEIFTWIRKQGWLGRLIIYYRDSQSVKWIKKGCRVEEIRRLNINVELWTFDRADARNYGMRYNPQFYFNNFNHKVEDILYDAVYVGASRGRVHKIDSLYDSLKSRGLKLKFIIQGGVVNNLKGKEGVRYIHRRLDYNDVINLNSKSKCIIEIMNEGQIGVTLRTMESLFMERKLITDNVDVLNMDIYHPDNVFVIGFDSMDNFDKWILKPYRKVDDAIKNEYTAESWIRKFDRL